MGDVRDMRDVAVAIDVRGVRDMSYVRDVQDEKFL